VDQYDTDITVYAWDHRNRLVKVTDYATYAAKLAETPSKIVEYTYDHGNRWVHTILDSDGNGQVDSGRVFVYDQSQIVLDYEHSGTGDATDADLAHRYLWGTGVDELLADEVVDDGGEEDVRWTLTDHLGSVRDMVVYDPITVLNQPEMEFLRRLG